jgi:hypothetical protein
MTLITDFAAFSIGLLVKLFKYLHNCCKQVENSKGPMWFSTCSWNNVPGENNSQLLTSLKEIFMLEKIDADNTTIKKSPDNSSITVTAPQITIVIKLDEKAKKAITTLDMTGNNSKKIRLHDIISWR